MKKWIAGFMIFVIGIGLGYYFFPETELSASVKIDKLIVVKSERLMYAYSNQELVKTYKISLGKEPSGDKKSQGDKRTPEGEYKINDRNPNSGFHKNLGISYPNRIDIREAKAKGLDPGGDIKIHGLKNGFGYIGKFHRLFDWTAGCIAVTDEEIDELYQSVQNGTSIIIRP